MNLILAIGLIWLAFAAGYCLSGMLGAGTTEDLRREVQWLNSEIQSLRERNKKLKFENERLARDNDAIYLVHKDKSKV
ncbi:hypothetical protein [Mesotoga sp.]|uniref:hypothetical protein n=1 Tax=Mesotoga sp. TaxID=2053577 RepID=UPI00345EA5B3